jgi:uncharacterized protein YjbJ (UPF0337 family)
MTAIDLSSKELWLPGRGVMPAHVRQATQAVREYGADLGLARHEASGEWVVTKNGAPVFGLGTDLPAPERIKEMLYGSDAQRHGGKLAEKIQKLTDARQRAAKSHAEDLTGVAAEALEWAQHKEGRTSYKRVYVPKGVSK